MIGEGLSGIIFSYEFLFFLKGALLAGCFASAVGIKPFKAFAVPTVLLLLIADMITKGFNGFVNHAELGLLYSSVVLMLFPSADGFSIKHSIINKQISDSKYLYIVPVFAISFAICLAYCFVGLNRFLFGGLEQFYNNALNIHLITNSLNYTKYELDWGLFITNSITLLYLFKFGFFVISVFEVLSPLILFFRKFRIVWLAVIIPFHFLSLITMKIFFLGKYDTDTCNLCSNRRVYAK